MKLTWIQRLVLLILFSFLLSGCKGDMTDTGNETDIPDKNAVVTESMSEELPVEQTEESASVLVQDLGELLCERDSVRDLMLVVDRRGLDDITVMTSEEERERILDELYAADLSGFESAGPREAGGIVEKYKIQTDEMEVSLSIYQDMTGNYQYITIAGPDRRPISEIKGPAGAFDFPRLGKLAAEVRTNTEDPLYSGTASVPESGYETKMNKLACGYALYFFETALREEAMEAPGEGESFDVQIKIGEMVYQLQSDTGYFSRTDSQGTSYGKLAEDALLVVLTEAQVGHSLKEP